MIQKRKKGGKISITRTSNTSPHRVTAIKSQFRITIYRCYSNARVITYCATCLGYPVLPHRCCVFFCRGRFAKSTTLLPFDVCLRVFFLFFFFFASYRAFTTYISKSNIFPFVRDRILLTRRCDFIIRW